MHVIQCGPREVAPRPASLIADESITPLNPTSLKVLCPPPDHVPVQEERAAAIGNVPPLVSRSDRCDTTTSLITRAARASSQPQHPTRMTSTTRDSVLQSIRTLLADAEKLPPNIFDDQAARRSIQRQIANLKSAITTPFEGVGELCFQVRPHDSPLQEEADDGMIAPPECCCQDSSGGQVVRGPCRWPSQNGPRHCRCHRRGTSAHRSVPGYLPAVLCA